MTDEQGRELSRLYCDSYQPGQYELFLQLCVEIQNKAPPVLTHPSQPKEMNVLRPMETWAYMSYSLWGNGGVFSSPVTVAGGVMPGSCPHVFFHSQDVVKEEEDCGGRDVWVWLETWGVW